MMKAIYPGLFYIAILFTFHLPVGWSDTISSQEVIQHKVLADQHLQEGKNALAIEGYQKTIKLEPAYSAAYFNLAIAAYAEKDIQTAIDALEAFLNINPQDTEAHYNLACLRLYQHKLDEAQLHFDRAKLYSQGDSLFLPRIQQGLDCLKDLTKSDSSTQALALFLIQLQAGLSPSPVVF